MGGFIMQKTIRMTMAFLFSILMLINLSGCLENSEPDYVPESAAALWEKVDQMMNNLESVELDTTTKVIFFNSGYRFELNGTASVLSTKECHYSQHENTVSSEELSMEQTTTAIEAYYDGKMYMAVNNGTYDQKLCSEMTHEEYDRVQEGNLTDEIDIVNCLEGSYSKLEDGTWNLKFSGYTKKTIDKVLDVLLITDDMLGAPIADMEVNLIANADFYVQKLEIKFVFSAQSGQMTPEFVVTAVYSNYNTATFDAAVLNSEEYTLVDDVRVIDAVTTGIQEKQNAQNDEFTLDIESSYEHLGVTQETAEFDHVIYGRKNSAYFYEIVAQMEGAEFLIQYQNGEQIVTAQEQTHTAPQSESDAKLFIDSLIDSARFNANAVTDIEKQEEDVYLLTCGQLDLEEYTQLMGSNNIVLTAANQQIVVTFQSGELLKVESTLTLEGTEADQTMKLVSHNIVSFEELPEEDNTVA